MNEGLRCPASTSGGGAPSIPYYSYSQTIQEKPCSKPTQQTMYCVCLTGIGEPPEGVIPEHVCNTSLEGLRDSVRRLLAEARGLICGPTIMFDCFEVLQEFNCLAHAIAAGLLTEKEFVTKYLTTDSGNPPRPLLRAQRAARSWRRYRTKTSRFARPLKAILSKVNISMRISNVTPAVNRLSRTRHQEAATHTKALRAKGTSKLLVRGATVATQTDTTTM